uniref:Sideroflexin-1 n=1 Tax=Timema shepardi TaxID=629360 RepID=A0A7R9G0Z5_TIMSH|nr:unnamed protein product [Timema shepardi]
MAKQGTVRLCLSSRHWREDDDTWTDVSAGSDEHGHHGLYDDILQAYLKMRTQRRQKDKLGLHLMHRNEQSTPAVVFWQWVNQSFNALVNYTNRSGSSPISNIQLGTSYVLATGGALTTAIGLNSLVKSAPPLIGRWVPFVAVAAANCINIPMMRLQEIQKGVPVVDSNGNVLGESTAAAKQGIALVTMSRLGMAMPGMGMYQTFYHYHPSRYGDQCFLAIMDESGRVALLTWCRSPQV